MDRQLGARASGAAAGQVEPRELLTVFVLAVAVALVSAVVVPLGFQGRDDLHYLLAAEQWLRNGVSIGQDHWSNRLPYVLSIAALRPIAGSWERALFLLHSICFVTTATLMWLIARRTFAERSIAWWGLAVFLATPLLFRYVSTFYPEPFEVALAAVTAWMVLVRKDVRSRIPWLLVAGVVGGLVLSVRQTALALPAAFAAIILLDEDEPFGARVRDVACLAAGYAVPVLAELAYYWAMTGDPLHRLSVDTRHVELVSPDRLEGGVPPASTRVLFNWDLASRWRIPSTVRSHWTISPIVRLFTSPGMLLTPWFALAGGLFAWRMGPRARQLALLVLLTVAVQYLLNTFVLSLPPNTRYFGLSLALMAVLAGVAFKQIPNRVIRLGAYVLLFAIPCAVAAMVQSRANVTDSLEREGGQGRPLYLAPRVANVVALRLKDDAGFASHVSTATPPANGTLAAFAYERPGYLKQVCGDGQPAFADAGTLLPPPSFWDAAQGSDLARHLPKKAASLLEGEAEPLYLLRRRC